MISEHEVITALWQVTLATWGLIAAIIVIGVIGTVVLAYLKRRLGR